MLAVGRARRVVSGLSSTCPSQRGADHSLSPARRMAAAWPAWAPPATAPILRAGRRCAGHTGTSRVCESAIFVPQGSPLRCAPPWRCLLLAREGNKPGVGQAKTARARHAPLAPSQARSQNDGCTALILRAGSRRAGLPHPRAACHRLVQRVAGSDVQPLLSVLSGRGDTRLGAGDGRRNSVGMLRASASVEAWQRVSDGAKPSSTPQRAGHADPLQGGPQRAGTPSHA